MRYFSTNQKLTATETFSGVTFGAAQLIGLTDRGRPAPNYLFDASAFSTHDYIRDPLVTRDFKT